MQQVPWTKSDSREEKSKCKFHEEQIKHGVFLEQKLSRNTKFVMQQIPWQKLILRGGKKSIYIFYNEKNNMQQVLGTKRARKKFHQQESAGNKFNEQNKFHK